MPDGTAGDLELGSDHLAGLANLPVVRRIAGIEGRVHFGLDPDEQVHHAYKRAGC